MSNQPSDMVALESLLPLFNEQLAQLSDGWQSDNATVEHMTQHYYDISGALTIANLPKLAGLASALSHLATANNTSASADKCRIGLVAHHLLHYELVQYVQTGVCREMLIKKTIEKINRLLQIDQVTEASSLVNARTNANATDVYAERQTQIVVAIPDCSSTEPLQQQHYEYLLLGWRQQVQQLLGTDTNQPTILNQLEKIARYLWQDVEVSETNHSNTQQRLWYLAELWLNNLASNETPTPISYVHLLSSLELALEARYHNKLTALSQNNEHSDTDANSVNSHRLDENLLEELIAELYSSISSLAILNQTAQTTINKLPTGRASTLFLTHILQQLDTAVFSLDNSAALITLLQQTKKQLQQRGWEQFVIMLEQILQLVDDSLVSNSKTNYAQQQGQIEYRLHSLYDAISTTLNAISDSDINPQSTTELNTEYLTLNQLNASTLLQLRVAMSEVQQRFDDYAQGQGKLLTISEAFKTVGADLEELGLPLIRPVINRLDGLFAQLLSYNITTPSIEVTETLAGSISIIELLLECLAQHIFDQQLLLQANFYLDQASALITAVIAKPAATTQHKIDTSNTVDNAIRYDDTGQLAANAWQVAQAQVVPDVFDGNQEIREIFIEEASEIAAKLEDSIVVWSENTQNLEPLVAVHSDFYTLKGSGRMIGAFSISESSWALEHLLINILDKSLAISADLVTLVTQVVAQLPLLITDFSAMRAPQFDPAKTILQSTNLLTGLPLSHGLDFENAENNSVENDNAENDSAEHDSEVQNSPDLANAIEVNEEVVVDSQVAFDDNEESISDDISSAEYDALTKDELVDALDVPPILEPFMQRAVDMPADTNDTDPDIKEIFIEEAAEVLDDIVPLYQQWQADSTNTTALTDVRRGFHTLKGSGRMVGANYTAELAWALESMLNKIIESKLTVSKDMQQLITDVLAAYPKIIDIFASGSQEYPAIVTLWTACAHAYSQQHSDHFSYRALHSQWLANAQIKPSDASQGIEVDDYSDSEGAKLLSSNDGIISTPVQTIDATLETILSVNDMIADAPMFIAAQSSEDQEFYEIFIEEALGLLTDIDNFVSVNINQSQVEVSDEIVRAFHTLRAASGSNALVAISEVSATIEQSLEHLQKHDTPMNSQHLQALTQSVALIKGYLDGYAQGMQQHLSTSVTDSQQDVATLQAMLEDSDDTQGIVEQKTRIEDLLALEIDTLLDADWQLTEMLDEVDLENTRHYIQQMREQISRLLTETTELTKFTTILSALAHVYQYLDEHIQSAKDKSIQDALLTGHRHLISLFDSLAGRMSFKIDQQIIDNLGAAIIEDESRSLTATVEQVPSTLLVEPIVEIATIGELVFENIHADTELLEIFLEEAQELDSDIAQAFIDWRSDIANVATLKLLQRHLHTVKGGARMADIRSIGDLTHSVESIYEAFLNQKLSPTLQWVTILQIVQDTLSLQLDYIARYDRSFMANELIMQLQELAQQSDLPTIVKLTLPLLQYPTTFSTDKSEVDESGDGHNKTKIVELKPVDIDTLIAHSWTHGLPDPDILEVFLEEIAELVVNSQAYVQLLLQDPSDSNAIQALQRDLHTIKGGARMIAADGIADLAHQMETVYELLAVKRRPATQHILKLLTVCHEWLADTVFVLKHSVNPLMPVQLIKELEAFNTDANVVSRSIPSESLQTQIDAILAAKSQQRVAPSNTVSSNVVPSHVENISQMPSMNGSFVEPERSTDTSDEMIRISSSLVERMINLSGESAINRARIDMGMSSLTSSIEEMGTTVQRLADQLRRMETELEAQILSQIDEDIIQSEDFDPLEMDQYSSLNQLSKSLSESASDLVDINHTLLEKTRDSESLLLQLSRTQTELQDGLMKSRMVPFLRLKPRLDLIVRQTANELNKSVNLSIVTADDELDRTILERITSPLEHMIRNAVDHGIEDSETRKNAGKNSSGQINLEVLREGSEVVIHLSDDGRGINVDAVRKEAVAKGFIESNNHTLSDFDIMQYIFNAGITTSKQVTQISGRGVGMDVVASEIRQLGGLVSVTSEAGAGTRFTMRVPLTVAVSDALVVRAADRYYAIPLTQIERVVRINPNKLYDYYQSHAAMMEIEGTDYRVHYLNDLMSGSRFNELMVSTNTSLPVIIVKNSSGQNLALQVDQIAGSRIEVVVKPMGQQFANLAGISAATIMGNGSVMLILDLIALLRQTSSKDINATGQAIPALDIQHSQRNPTVLVVDDSVTVRKVTSRFLERQGLTAVVAKDGIDAIEILQELTPDIILLDIEMPRMDGFEVASQVRNNVRLKQIPIIMITSRTGEKHRTRAFEIGVDDYMGKPFQETELMQKIQALLKSEVSSIQAD